MKRIVSFVLKLLVTAGLFLLLFRPETYGLSADFLGGVKPWDILNEIRKAGTGNIVFWLLLGVLIKLGGMLCGVLRWRLLLRGQGLRIPFWYLVQSWFVGRSFGLFLPGTIGLDGYRLYDSAMYTGEVIKCGTVVAVEKLIGFIVLSALVFVTLPLGMRLPHLQFRLPVLFGILSVLGALIVVLFLLLLNPRVIQILIAVIPTPAGIRNKLNKLAAAATAYSNNRSELMLAVLFGFMVHVATSLTYFCTMMSIRASNTSLTDILFAAPLMITGTVFGPSIGGEGIREIVFVSLLGASSGVAAALTFSHLGWWVGDFVPAIIGFPIFVIRKRPGRKELQSELAQARREVAAAEQYLHLPGEVVSAYRKKVLGTLFAGFIGGLIAGSIVGLGEAGWLWKSLCGLTETQMFPWGAAVYGLLFAGLGLGIASALLFLYLLLDRFASAAFSFALSLGAVLAMGGLVIGIWRLKRDVLLHHAGTLSQYGQVAAYVIGASLILLVVAYVLTEQISKLAARKGVVLLALGVLVYLGLVGTGVALAKKTAPPVQTVRFEAPVKAAGPNIILITADALRADYLPSYNKEAQAKTPDLDAFTQDGVLFENMFSQACWTKPSFATLFTGLYPDLHTATSQTAALPDGVDTLAGALTRGGYYAKGFANNPNISAVFNFGKGFSDYTDLPPRRYFGASLSSSKLSMYEVLRKGFQRVRAKLGRVLPFVPQMEVRDFYQPGDEVTQTALQWIDGKPTPKETPFFLFLHYMDTHDPFMDHHKRGVGYARAVLGDAPDPKFEGPMREAYITDIEFLDGALKDLFKGLRERNLYDDALIVFMADHGEEFRDHDGFWHGFTLYDEMLRVPLILKLPGKAHAGERNTGFARSVDVAPTLLQFAGQPRVPAMNGQPLFDAAGAFANAGIQYVYAHNDFEGNLLHSVQNTESKLISANPDNVRHLAPVELYDMTRDPKEKSNLAGDPKRGTQQMELQQILERLASGRDVSAAPPSENASMSEEVKNQLQSLGYLDSGK